MSAMDAASPGREFHAVLTQVEPDLFRADYLAVTNPEAPAEGQALPDSHIGTSAEDVRIWVEQMARSMGYDRVVWEPARSGPYGGT